MSKLSGLHKLASELDLKDVVKGAIRRFFLPDMVWKLTFIVVGVGASIILFPTPLKVLVWNLLIATFNVNAGVPVTIPEVSSANADYWMGLVLIVLGLVYNFASRVAQFYTDHFARLVKDAVVMVDKRLFESFLADLPSASWVMELARNHDFGHSFNVDHTDKLDEFIIMWQHPEYTFLDPDLEGKKLELYSKGVEFNSFMAFKSAPIGANRQSIVPPGTNDFDWSPQLEEDVQTGNRLGTEFANLHREFILLARSTLIC